MKIKALSNLGDIELETIECENVCNGNVFDCSFTIKFKSSWHPFEVLYCYNGFLTEC